MPHLGHIKFDTRFCALGFDLMIVEVKSSIARLKPFADEKAGIVNAVVETPEGSENKFDYDIETGLFELGSAMPAGVIFPFEFGFIPSTKGADGDPLDILILMDSPTFTSCLVRVRLIGVIEAEQTEKDGKRIRNDRLVGVAIKSRHHEDITTLKNLPDHLTSEIEHFFKSYNSIKGKKFRVLGCRGPKHALKLVKAGHRRK